LDGFSRIYLEELPVRAFPECSARFESGVKQRRSDGSVDRRPAHFLLHEPEDAGEAFERWGSCVLYLIQSDFSLPQFDAFLAPQLMQEQKLDIPLVFSIPMDNTIRHGERATLVHTYYCTIGDGITVPCGMLRTRGPDKR